MELHVLPRAPVDEAKDLSGGYLDRIKKLQKLKASTTNLRKVLAQFASSYPPLDQLIVLIEQLPNAHAMIEALKRISARLWVIKNEHRENSNLFSALGKHVDKIKEQMIHCYEPFEQLDSLITRLEQLVKAYPITESMNKLRKVLGYFEGFNPDYRKQNISDSQLTQLLKTKPKINQVSYENRFVENKNELPITSDQLGISDIARGNP